MATTLSAKETSLSLTKKLDDDVTYEDIMCELHFLQKIERGLRDVEEGKTIPHEQVKEEIKKWFT